MSTAAEEYKARVDAFLQQIDRMRGARDDRWAATAARFRMDPHRKLEANTAAVAALIGPDDVVVDVGGGAGRVSLPLALHCAEVINVEPSAAMRTEFEASAAESGIGNARCLDADWPREAAGIEGDVVLVVDVTYFVRDIVPFVLALSAAARKRVIIKVWSVPPPNSAASLFEMVHGESHASVPGHRDLLPILWDLGILPEVRMLPDDMRPGGVAAHPQTIDEAVRSAVEWAIGATNPGAAEKVRAHFDELYAPSPEGFVPLWRLPSREMLITWETGSSPSRTPRT